MALLASVAMSANGLAVTAVQAQENGATASGLAPEIADGAKMLLRSNELVYNRDSESVTATGGVQIYYNRYRMVAQRVEYDQQTGPTMATATLHIIQP